MSLEGRIGCSHPHCFLKPHVPTYYSAASHGWGSSFIQLFTSGLRWWDSWQRLGQWNKSGVTLLPNSSPAVCNLRIKCLPYLCMTFTCDTLRNLTASRTLKSCRLGHKLVQPLWKNPRQQLLRLNIYQSYDLAIPLLGVCPRERSTYVQQET